MAVVKLLQAHPGGTGPLVVGETCLGKLEVRALLGRGGHAWVYECFDQFLQRTVAVKVIKTLHEAGRDLSRRARAEAQVLAGLEHPNLVRMIDAGTHGGLVYIVMEMLQGRTLRHALMSLSRLSVVEVLELASQIADGMQLAHDHGVIHRDLKPENIFIEAGNRVKVLDFGVAKVLGASFVTTQKDRLQGTFLYMSPEQLQGVAVTPASDVFALGTMMFEMLYAHPLTLGGSDLRNNEHVAWMQLHQVPPPLEALDPSIPRYVGKLVGRAVVKLPSERFQTMRDLRQAAMEALRRYRADHAPRADVTRDLSKSTVDPLPLSATIRRSPNPVALVSKAEEARAPSRSSGPEPGQVVAKHPSAEWRRAVVLGLLCGVGVLAIAFGWRRSEAPSTVSSVAASVPSTNYASVNLASAVPPQPARVEAATPASSASAAMMSAAIIPTAASSTKPRAVAPALSSRRSSESSKLADESQVRRGATVAAQPPASRTRETIF